MIFGQVNITQTDELLCPFGLSDSDQRNVMHLCASFVTVIKGFDYRALSVYFDNQLKATQTFEDNLLYLKGRGNKLVVTYDYDSG